MKKFLSILLVAMLIISMIPATVSAEDSTATITFDNVSKRESKSSDLQVWKENGITVNYGKGNYNSGVNNDYYNPLRFYAATTLQIVYPGMTKLVFNCASSYADELQASTYPSGVTATYSGNVVTVTPNAAVDSITITIGKQTRISSITVTYEASTSTEPECEHANTTTTTVDATCTEDGSATVTCDDCGKTVSEETISALGHNFVGGVCNNDGCGEKEPEGYVLTDISKIKITDTFVIVATKASGTYAMSNNNGTGSAPAAIEVTLSADGKALTHVNGAAIDDTTAANVVWNISGSGSYTFYPAGQTAKWLYCTSTNNGVRVGTNTNSAFTVDTTGYLKHTGTSRYLGVYNAQDWRCYTSYTTANIANQTFAFYVKPAEDTGCAHTNTTQIAEVPANCTETGTTAGVKCLDCEEILEGCEIIAALGHSWDEGEVTTSATCTEAGKRTYTCTVCDDTKTETIDALGHNYVEDVCTNCGAEVVDLSGQYYIAAIRKDGPSYFYMSSDLGEVSTKRYQAVDSGLSELPASIIIDNAVENQIFELTMTEADTYTIQAMGAEEDQNYLSWTSGNSGSLSDTAKAFTVTANEDGTFRIYFNDGSDDRFLQLNSNANNGYFAWYTSDQIKDLVLIPVGEAVVEDDEETAYTSVEVALKAGATTLKALDESTEMPFEVTVDGATYIGLADANEEFYTYYELTLKMSSISLRGSEAGIYYGAKVVCDDALAQAVDSYGIVLNTSAMPTDLDAAKGNAYTVIEGTVDTSKTIMSGSVFNIFEEGREDSVNASRGEVSIYAVVYLEIDGQYVFSKQEVSWSLKDVVETIDTAIAEGGKLEGKLDADQEAALVAFYQKWAVDNKVIVDWKLTNIANLYKASLA